MPSSFLALVGVGTVVAVSVSEVVLGVLGAGTRREGVGVERALDAPGDLLGGDRLAVLPRRVVADRERPLGEVLVGAAQVGREVRDEDHLAGLVVAGVLGQRPVRERLLDRVARHRPAVGRVEVLGARVVRQVHRDGAARRSALDLGRGALALWVLGDGLRSILEALAAGAATGLVVVPAAAATGSEGHERGTGGECCRRLGPSHCPAFRCCSHTGNARVTSVEDLRLSGGSSGRTRLEPRRRGG